MSLTHKLHHEHTERLARWEAKAVPDAGIDLKRKPAEPPPEPEEAEPEEPPTPQLRTRHIVHTVCLHFGITEAALMSLHRVHAIMRPRHVCMYLLRTHTRLSLPQIGRRLGGFDHTTVMHGCRRIAQQRNVDPVLDGDIRKIEAAMRELPTHSKYGDEQKYLELRREIAARLRDYPKEVAAGNMTEATARERIEMLQQIAEDYIAKEPQ